MSLKNFFKGNKEKPAEADDIAVEEPELAGKDISPKTDVKDELKTEPGILQGNLLVATNQIQDQCFGKSVVFMATHNERGAMGLIINKSLKTPSSDEILKNLGVELPEGSEIDLPVYFGGPIDTSRGFVLHSDEYQIKNTVTFPNGVAISAEKQVLTDYIEGKGPKQIALVMGYSGWTEGQLDMEINEGSWIFAPASKKIVLDIPNEFKWKKAQDSQGVDLFKLSPFIGNA